uniref:Uncharacterized protein n=1 Tax=Anopheles minimus TaxID=112268 RepID=A0A182WPV9_9DIPT
MMYASRRSDRSRPGSHSPAKIDGWERAEYHQQPHPQQQQQQQ